jgi:hypothetical protein
VSAAEVGLIITIISAMVLEAAGLYICWKLWREGVDQCHK